MSTPSFLFIYPSPQGLLTSKPLAYPMRDTVNVALAGGSLLGLGTLLGCVGAAAPVTVGTGALALGCSTVLATVLGAQLSAGVGSADVPVSCWYNTAVWKNCS